MTNKFQVGKTYATRSICDHNCIFSYTIVSRTEKTVTIKSGDKTTRRKVREYDGAEVIDPLGRYSMSPVLSANKVAI